MNVSSLCHFFLLNIIEPNSQGHCLATSTSGVLSEEERSAKRFLPYSFRGLSVSSLAHQRNVASSISLPLGRVWALEKVRVRPFKEKLALPDPVPSLLPLERDLCNGTLSQKRMSTGLNFSKAGEPFRVHRPLRITVGPLAETSKPEEWRQDLYFQCIGFKGIASLPNCNTWFRVDFKWNPILKIIDLVTMRTEKTIQSIELIQFPMRLINMAHGQDWEGKEMDLNLTHPYWWDIIVTFRGCLQPDKGVNNIIKQDLETLGISIWRCFTEKKSQEARNDGVPAARPQKTPEKSISSGTVKTAHLPKHG